MLEFKRIGCVSFWLNKNTIHNSGGIDIFDFGLDLIEKEAMSLVIGVIDWGKEADVAGGAGD